MSMQCRYLTHKAASKRTYFKVQNNQGKNQKISNHPTFSPPAEKGEPKHKTIKEKHKRDYAFYNLDGIKPQHQQKPDPLPPSQPHQSSSPYSCPQRSAPPSPSARPPSASQTPSYPSP